MIYFFAKLLQKWRNALVLVLFLQEVPLGLPCLNLDLFELISGSSNEHNIKEMFGPEGKLLPPPSVLHIHFSLRVFLTIKSIDMHISVQVGYENSSAVFHIELNTRPFTFHDNTRMPDV